MNPYKTTVRLTVLGLAAYGGRTLWNQYEEGPKRRQSVTPPEQPAF